MVVEDILVLKITDENCTNKNYAVYCKKTKYPPNYKILQEGFL